MEQSIKPRRYDLAPDEFLAAVAGEMSPAELGVYWMICLLQYSRRGPIKNDMPWLRRKFRTSPGLQIVDRIVRDLIASGRVQLDASSLRVPRVDEEVARATARVESSVENGTRGGRPSKEINGVEKAPGYPRARPRALQLPTTNTIKKKPSSSDREGAARAALPNGGAAHARDAEPVTWKRAGTALDLPPPPPTSQDHRMERHLEFLHASASPDEVGLYIAAVMSDDPEDARRMFELTEARMAAA